MKREKLVRVALLAYPEDIRRARGEEMSATLLDCSESSQGRFAVELYSLALAGLRARAKGTANEGTRRVLADGLCLAAIWWITFELSSMLAHRVRGSGPAHGPLHQAVASSPMIGLLIAILCLALVGHDRIAGIGALLWTACFSATLFSILPLICFAVMVLAPRERPHRVRGLAWLIVPLSLMLALGPSNREHSVVVVSLIALAASLVVLFAVAMLLTDPRWAIAGAIPLSNIGIAIAHKPSVPTLMSVLVIAPTPLVLAIASTRIRRLREQTPL